MAAFMVTGARVRENRFVIVIVIVIFHLIIIDVVITILIVTIINIMIMIIRHWLSFPREEQTS